MIRFENISKSYGGGKTRAVDGLSMEVKSGKVFGFIGPNGAGKTTTIKLMTGILQPDDGEIWLDEHSMKQEPLAAKRIFGFVPDTFEMYDRLTGLEYLRFLSDVYGVDAARRKSHIDAYLERYGLQDAKEQQIRSYSHGMKQKLQIIGSLIHEPDIWILDEPMVGLDPASMHVLKEDMRALCDAGKTVFFSTHVLDVAERLCDEIGIIRRGKLIAQGGLDELRQGDSAATLEDVFLELTETAEK